MTNVNIILKTLSSELLQMSVKPDDTLKTVAQKLVLNEPQWFKCPSFVQISRFNGKMVENEEWWEEGEIAMVFYNPEIKSCSIHDNGGVPFIVEITDDAIYIYSNSNSNSTHSEDDYKTVKGELLYQTPFPYEKVWIGDNDLNHDNYTEKDIYPGNSILVHLSGNTYMYIGSEIYNFDVEEGDHIVSYFSPVGNNDVPYPYAIGEKMIYFMLEQKVVPIDSFDIKSDCYRQFYDQYEDNQDMSNFRDVKLIQERR